MGSVYHDLHTLQGEVGAKGAFAEFDVTTGRIVQTSRLAQRGRIHPGSRFCPGPADGNFPGVGQLCPWALKNLMPLSSNGLWLALMTTPNEARCAPGQVGHARRRQWSQQHHVHPGRIEALSSALSSM